MDIITTIEEYDKIRKRLGLSDRRVIADIAKSGHKLNKDFFTFWRKGRVKCPQVHNLKAITEYLKKREKLWELINMDNV
jgi:predicted transcriptional regulator